MAPTWGTLFPDKPMFFVYFFGPLPQNLMRGDGFVNSFPNSRVVLSPCLLLQIDHIIGIYHLKILGLFVCNQKSKYFS